MQGPKAALVLAGFLASLSLAAAAEPLGDRIAEVLCYPPSAERMTISEIEADRLLSSPPVSGDYRDIQGADARAWFEILQDGTARCRTPANSAMTLYFCARVALEDGALLRKRQRLCELP